MKAKNLKILKDAGFNVPDFVVVSSAEDFNPELLESAEYAVRSSYSKEDTDSHSYAGQFKTVLNVPKEEVVKAIKEVLQSADSDNIAIYKEHIDEGLDDTPSFQVIVQSMVKADESGIVFSANPRGLLNEIVIVCARGQGDMVVSDQADTVSFHYNRDDKSMYKVVSGEDFKFFTSKIEELIQTAIKIEELFAKPVDIEYAYHKDRLYILQARPISSLNKDKAKIILDDSNIAESYAGLSLPLTQSFAKEIYKGVFRSLLCRFIGEKEFKKRFLSLVPDMVMSCNYHIYYNISNWYEVLRLLPFSKKMIAIWQKMLGVQEKSVEFVLDKPGILLKSRLVLSFIRLLFSVTKKMQKLNEDFIEISTKYDPLLKESVDPKELWDLYIELKSLILENWDWTLINDMYAFIFTALSSGYKEELKSFGRLESMRPVEELEKLLVLAADNGMDSQLYKEEAGKYIASYGDRCIDELKLESKTYRTHPELLDEYVLARIEDKDSVKNAANSMDSAKIPVLDTHIEDADSTKERRKANFVSRFFMKQARIGIMGRELSRLNRSRIFGIMRDIIRKIAYSDKIALYEDIFFLELDELEQLIYDEKNFTDLINKRKRKYERLKYAPIASRLVFAGEVFDISDNIYIEADADIQTEAVSEQKLLYGTAVSEGVVRGEVLIVKDTLKLAKQDVKDKIIVTVSTDPGWFMIVSNCLGIIASKGSLLSHTSIIARELKKPAVVAVKEAFLVLRDGDYVELDAYEGSIRILERKVKN